jgi:hypothetical protein
MQYSNRFSIICKLELWGPIAIKRPTNKMVKPIGNQSLASEKRATLFVAPSNKFWINLLNIFLICFQLNGQKMALTIAHLENSKKQ